MPSTSWICGSVCSTKFLGLPPPMISTPLLPPCVLAWNTTAEVSFTSALTSKRSCEPVSACSATFIPMDESPEGTWKTGPPASWPELGSHFAGVPSPCQLAVPRDAALMGRPHHLLAPDPQRLLALADVATQQVVVLSRAHGSLELGSNGDLADVRVGREQDLVVEEDFLYADDP